MSDTTDDPMTAYLRNRLTEIDTEIADRQAWRVEAQRTLDVWLDGRSRVNRQRKTRTAGNSSAHGLAPTPELQAAAQQIAADWEGEVRGT